MLQISSIYDSRVMYVKYHNGSTSNTSLIVIQMHNCLPHPLIRTLIRQTYSYSVHIILLLKDIDFDLRPSYDMHTHGT